MLPSGSDGEAADGRRAERRALAASLLLFAGVVAFVGSCGGDDLIFPGMGAVTATAQLTDTPGPTVTPAATM